jgi:hypothetical protein
MSSAALEQDIVCSALKQRVLEAIVGLRRRALDKQEVGLGETLQRRPQSRLVELGDVSQQRVGEIASQHRADLRDIASRAEAVQTGGERLLQGRRDGLNALIPALEKQAGHFLDEQRHAAGPLVYALNYLLGERMVGRDLTDHARDPGAIQRGESNQTVVRA